MTAFNPEHRKWVDTFLKHSGGSISATAAPGAPGVLMAGPSQSGFGNNPHEVKLPKDSKQPLPDRPGMVATSEGRLVQSVPPTADVNKTFNDFTLKLVKLDKEAVALRAKLNALDKDEKKVREFIESNSKNLDAELAKNQSEPIKNVARDMDQEHEYFELVQTVFSGFKLTIEDAKSRLDSAKLKLDSIQNLDAARRLSLKVQQQSQSLDTTLSLVGNVIEAGVAVLTENPAGAIKPIYDAITTIKKLKTENPLAKEAEEDRRTGTNQALQAAIIDIDAATKLTDGASELANSTEQKQLKGFANYLEMRDEVEGLYDGSTQGKFKFADLAIHLKWTETSASLGVQTFEAYEKAYFYADGLRDIYRAVIDQMKPQGDDFMEAVLVLKQLAIAHAKGKNDTKTKLQQFAALGGSLALMRDNATQKLAHTPVPKNRSK